MARSIDPFTKVATVFDLAIEQITRWGQDHEEQEAIDILINSIRQFGSRYVDAERIDSEKCIPEQVLRAAAEMGLFGLSIEPQYGGAGLSMKGTCRVLQALGNMDSSVGVSIGLHNGLGLRGLNYYASEKLKNLYLPDLATGKSVACFPVTEPEAGSDIASLRTRAEENGEELIVSGNKIFATNGGFAHLATIVARTSGTKGSRGGHTMLLVPLDLPGVSRGPEERKLGIRGSSTCSIHFEEVKIPKDHIIGHPSNGLNQMKHVLSWGRTFIGAGLIGVARKAFERTLEQVTTRRQFNRPIGEFGMVREKIARMRAQIHAMESAILLASLLEDNQPESIGWESSVCKVYCSESTWYITDETVQLHGGSGFIEDTGVARLLRDCRIARIFEGTNELLRFHIAAEAFTWNLSRLTAHTWTPKVDEALREPTRNFDDFVRKLKETLQRNSKRYGLKVFQRQIDQSRLADAASALFVILSLIIRAQGELRIGKLTDERLMLTKLCIHDLFQKVEHRLAEVDTNADNWVDQIAIWEYERNGGNLKDRN